MPPRRRARAGRSTSPIAPPRSRRASAAASPPRATAAAAAPAAAATNRRRRAPSPEAPRRFHVGPAISVYQNSGDPGSNWAAWEARRAWGGLRPTTMGGLRCGISCDFWHRYADDIRLTAAIGSNALRLSLEWSRVVPSPGVVDRAALNHYAAIFRACAAAGVTPLVTLHHFVQPAWVDAGGGFDGAPEWATRHWLEFVRLAVRTFGAAVYHWCTFNEPGVYVSSGWVTGFFPPGRFMALRDGGRTLLALLRAHSAAVRVIRKTAAATPHALPPSIGIVHNIMPYAAAAAPPWLGGWRAPWSIGAAKLAHACWGNEIVLTYLSSGAFDWRPAGALGPRVAAADARPPRLDWMGLNFYGRVLLDPLLRPTAAPGEASNDFRQGVWPAGFKAALHAAAGVGAPVCVMETGLPDAADTVRAHWAREYMRAAREAVDEGVDLRAMMIWTLCSNFEWAFSYHADFGMFKWDRHDPTSARVPRGSLPVVLRELARLKRHVEARWAAQGRAVDASGNAPPGEYGSGSPRRAPPPPPAAAANKNNVVPAPVRRAAGGGAPARKKRGAGEVAPAPPPPPKRATRAAAGAKAKAAAPAPKKRAAAATAAAGRATRARTR